MRFFEGIGVQIRALSLELVQPPSSSVGLDFEETDVILPIFARGDDVPTLADVRRHISAALQRLAESYGTFSTSTTGQASH